MTSRTSQRRDQPDRDREVSPSTLVADMGAYLREYASRSALAHRGYRSLRDLRYGPAREELLDFFPATSRQPRRAAPLHVFVHGGYWQELSKDESSFVAPAFLASGAAFAAIGYGLAPGYRLDDITMMIVRALRWLIHRADDLRIDPRAIQVSGSSAGAHLALMAVCLDAELRRSIAGIVLLSGVYDLRPLVGTYVNEALGLSDDDAARNSPLLRLPESLPPVVIARGGRETSEFIRQHEQMLRALRGRTTVTEIVSPARNHFDLPYELADRDTDLGAAVLAGLGLMPGGHPMPGVHPM